MLSSHLANILKSIEISNLDTRVPPTRPQPLHRQPTLLKLWPKIRLRRPFPWKGCTYIIQYSKTGEALTLLDGQVVLEKPGGCGHFKWHCVETEGWMGFRNPISGKYLGEDNGELVCMVGHHLSCEHFIAQPVPDGGYLLLMRQDGKGWGFGEKLRVVGLKHFGSEKRLAKVEVADGIVWDFVKV